MVSLWYSVIVALGYFLGIMFIFRARANVGTEFESSLIPDKGQYYSYEKGIFFDFKRASCNSEQLHNVI
jgi:hypothetical protein